MARIAFIKMIMAALLPSCPVVNAFSKSTVSTNDYRRTPLFVSAGSTSTITSTATSSIAEEEDPPVRVVNVHQVTSFETPPMQLYRDDSTAGHFLSIYERALELAAMPAGVTAHEHWFVWGLAANEYNDGSLLKVGQDYFVEGELVERNCEGVWLERWKVEMVSLDKTTVYNSAQITVSCLPKGNQRLPQYYSSPPCQKGQDSNTDYRDYTLFRGDFDPHLPNRIPLRMVLQLFERARDSYFSTASPLDTETTVVAIEDCEICNPNLAGWGLPREMQQNPALIQCQPGSKVTVQTEYASASEEDDSLIECRQTLLLLPALDGKSQDRRLAQAIITVRLENPNLQPSTPDSPAMDATAIQEHPSTSRTVNEEEIPGVRAVTPDEPLSSTPWTRSSMLGRSGPEWQHHA